MPEDYDAHESFKNYLKEHEGEEISLWARRAGEGEMRDGEKGDFAVYGDEPDKAKIAASYPDGGLRRRYLELRISEQAAKELRRSDYMTALRFGDLAERLKKEGILNEKMTYNEILEIMRVLADNLNQEKSDPEKGE